MSPMLHCEPRSINSDGRNPADMRRVSSALLAMCGSRPPTKRLFNPPTVRSSADIVRQHLCQSDAIVVAKRCDPSPDDFRGRLWRGARRLARRHRLVGGDHDRRPQNAARHAADATHCAEIDPARVGLQVAHLKLIAGLAAIQGKFEDRMRAIEDEFARGLERIVREETDA